VNSVWREVVATEPEQLVGPQEQFKYEWFSAYMSERMGIDGSLDRLLRAAKRQAQLDLPSHLKMMWLGSIIFGTRFTLASQLEPSRVRASLFENRLGWFAGFAQRWLRATRARPS